jgi:hypothetical protein
MMTLPTHLSFQDSLCDLSAIGVSASEVGDNYGIIEARSNKRWWIVPLTNSKQSVTGLSLYQPASKIGLASKSIASFFCEKGLHKLVFRKTMGLDFSKVNEIKFVEQAQTHVAIFTGTTGPHRKTAIQFANNEGEVLGYGKISRSNNITPFLTAEAEMLQRIAAMRLTSIDYPRLIDFRSDTNLSFLITDGKTKKTSGTDLELSNEHLLFVKEFYEATKSTCWDVLIKNLMTDYNTINKNIPECWSVRFGKSIQLLEKGPILPTSLAHGDFTPWNCFLNDILYVFDWEYSGEQAFAYDICHFVYVTSKKKTPFEIVAKCIKKIKIINNQLDDKKLYSLILYYFTSHSIFYSKRELIMFDQIESWTESELYGQIIDFLLDQI